MSDFLKNLENGSFTPEPSEKDVKQLKREAKEYEREVKRQVAEQERQQRKLEKQMKKEEEDEGDKPAGPEKIRLIMKIKKYQELFPDEVKHFKMKKNPSVEQLEAYIEELQIITESGGMDAFFNDIVLECIKGVENISTCTENYNISGVSILLKSNKKFNTLCKQLQLKYNIFVNVPPEIQLVLIISTTSMLCMNKNKNKKELNSYLDQPIEREIII